MFRCDRRCEAVGGDLPPGYPGVGFYCSLHAYQSPSTSPDGSLAFESPDIENHIRKRTSFVAPEASVAQDILRAPGVVRERGDGEKSASGASVLNWLVDNRHLDELGARAYAQRMLDLGMLRSLNPAIREFSTDRGAFYKVVVPSSGAAASGGGGAAKK
ncbi:hypothetical protein EON68_03305 [archaeon]|nr:MAG: hypothetical protein EON68_03305 [archaeon]